MKNNFFIKETKIVTERVKTEQMLKVVVLLEWRYEEFSDVQYEWISKKSIHFEFFSEKISSIKNLLAHLYIQLISAEKTVNYQSLIKKKIKGENVYVILTMKIASHSRGGKKIKKGNDRK